MVRDVLRGLVVPTIIVSWALFSPQATGRQLLHQKPFEAPSTVEIDPDSAVEVFNLSLYRQEGEITLRGGVLAFQRSPTSPAAALFQGNGVLRWTPSDEIEAQQLKRYTKASFLDTTFTNAVLWFSSDLRKELLSSCQKATLQGTFKGELLRSRFQFWEKLGVDFRLRAIESRMNRLDQGFLAIDMDTIQEGWILFVRDPGQPEEIQLGQAVRRSGWTYDTWNSFTIEPQGRGVSAPRKDSVDVLHHKIRLKIDDDEYLSGQDDLRLKSLAGRVNAIPFSITKKLRVQRIVDGQGTELDFIQPEFMDPRDELGDSISSGVSSDNFLVFLHEPLSPGQEQELHVYFEEARREGKIVEKAGRGVFFVGNRWNWYPDYGEFNARRATFDLEFTYPSKYTLVGIGTKISEVAEGDWTISRWKMDQPVAVAGFNFGEFKTAEIVANHTKITAYANRYPDSALDSLRIPTEIPGSRLQLPPGLTNISPGRLAESVAAEVAESLKTFEDYFGPYPYPQLSVSQITGSFGQGWPTLLYVSGFSFLDGTQQHFLGMDVRTRRFFSKEINAHEASHQWWGHIVSWASYRDQWLSEGFATYSGLLYLERSLGREKFLSSMETYRDALLEKSSEGCGFSELGPIWLGHRLSSAKEPSGYQNLVYYKGAYILHMLRCMLTDLSKWDDSRFRNMMSEFVKSHSVAAASTAEFQSVVEKHMGEDMSWFFDQWVYGTEIPAYKTDWKIKPTGDGKFLLTLNVVQEDVTEPFRVVMPVRVNFETGYATLKMRINGPQTEGSVLLPAEPKGVEFNYYQGVLAK